MARSSIELSTVLDHRSEEDGGKMGDNAGGKAKDRLKDPPKDPQEERPRRRSVFSSLRDKAFALRSGARKSKSNSDSKSDDKVGSKTDDKTDIKAGVKAGGKNRLKVVANDESVGDVVGRSVGLKNSKVPSSAVAPDRVAEGDYLVHPAHGVGYVRGVEAEEIAGARMDMIAISFEQERMIVRVPTGEYENCGLRNVSSPEAMEDIYDTLKTKRRIRKTMWGRRAQEYDNKIRSGDPIRLAQVVRELYRGEEQPSPSYSERQYYQLALERLSREVAVVEKIEESLAVEKLETILAAA